MIILNVQKLSKVLIVFLGIAFMNACHAQTQTIKTFFETKKKNSYQNCVKESGINTIMHTEENKEIIALMIKGCKDRDIIFDNFMYATNTLIALQPKKKDFIIYNWKEYNHHIPAPSVTLLQANKINVVEFTYYDEVENKDKSTLERKMYEDKEGKFKNELMYIQSKLSGQKIEDNIAGYQRNDYYIIKKNNGNYYYYTLINGNLEKTK
jgi:hypothetical protein